MLEIEESQLERGARIADRYRLDHVLGEGGMGVVWEAIDETSGEARALKFIRRDKCGDGRSVARLLREAHAAKTVAHPSVARVFEVLELPEGTPFLVMERLHGETLKSRLARVEKLSPDELVPMAVAIASGVRAAHALGIVHRDLKPDNVFVLADGRVKVIDFGIAKDLRSEGEADLTTTGAMLGTLLYMAPEQVFGDVDIDERADVWALGVVLYECIAGRRPTDGAGSGQVLKAIMTQTFTPLAVASPGCPEALSNLVGLMLSRDRAERPSLDEVIDTLEGRVSRAPQKAVAVAAVMTPSVPSAPRSGRAIVGILGLGSVGAVVAAFAFRAANPTSGPAVLPSAASATTSPSVASTPMGPSVASAAALVPTAMTSPSARGVAGIGPSFTASTPAKTSASGSAKGGTGLVGRPVPSAPAVPSSSVSPAPSGAPSLPPLATSRRS